MASQEKEREPRKTALILSAGAPHSPLIAGALCALWDTGRTFDVVYTSGAGALIGLLYGAPKGKKPREALESLVDLGVSDPIYRLLPIGYKTFFKPGPFTRPISQFAQLFKIGGFPLPHIDRPVTGLGHAYNEWLRRWDTARGGELKRLYNDLVDLWAAAITPTPLNYWSKGVCDPLPFLEDLVDFHEVSGMPFHFYMNAFSVTERHRTLYANKGTTGEREYRRGDYRTRDLPKGETSPKPKKREYPEGGSEESDSTKSGLRMHLFYNRRKGEGIRPQDVRAAFAYPFIYPPVTIDGEVYFEGAGRDPISFGNLLVEPEEGLVRADVPDIERVVLIDILGALDQYLLREPRDLLDSFSLSIVAPAVAHARKEIARFWTALEEANEDLRIADQDFADRDLKEEAERARQAGQTPQVKAERELQKERTSRREKALKRLTKPDQALARITDFIPMSFDIDEDVGRHITDWSYSNMSHLFEIGLRDGKRFWEKNSAVLNLPFDPRQNGHRATRQPERR